MVAPKGRRAGDERRYGSVNQALSFGILIIAAGLTEDQADVNARTIWLDARNDIHMDNPGRLVTPPFVRHWAGPFAGSIRGGEFAAFDAKAETLRLLRQCGSAVQSWAA
ncbi:MAG TPA: hypothetical protein VGC09_11185 [Rhodopila sp.]